MSYLDINKQVLWDKYDLTPGMDIRNSLNLANKELSCPIVIIVREGTVKGTPTISLHGFENIQNAMQKLVEDMLAVFSVEKSELDYSILNGKSKLIGCILQGRPVKLVPSITGVAVLIEDEQGEYSLLSGVIKTKTIEVLDNERKESETASETSPETDGGEGGQDLSTSPDEEGPSDAGC